MRRWVWAGYGLSLAWVALLFLFIHRYLNAADRDAFRSEGRRLAEVWAGRLADAAPERRPGLLRRLSGERDSRSAALLDAQLHVIERVGPGLPNDPTEKDRTFRVSEPADHFLPPATWIFRSPLWGEGNPAGVLVWVRDSSALGRSRRHRRLAFLTAWGWWALAGGLGAAYWSRQIHRLSSHLPSLPA